MRLPICFFLCVFFLAACSPVAGVSLSTPSFVYFPPDEMIPFPSDAYLRLDDAPAPTAERGTGLRVDVARFAQADPALAYFPGIDAGLRDMDGFGTSAEIAVGLTGSPELGSLADEETAYEASVRTDSPIRLFSIKEDDPRAGEPVAFVARFEPEGKMLFLRPWRPLKAGGHYAVVFTEAFEDILGRPFMGPPGFSESYRAGRGPGLAGAGYARLRAVYAGEPVFALTFHTASIRPFFQYLLDDVRAEEPSPLVLEAKPPGAVMPSVRALVEGQFLRRDFRSGEGKLVRNEQGAEWTRFTLTLPVTSAAKPGPFPVVLGQHGINDRRGAVLAQAEFWAAAGFATLAIDAPEHGSRASHDGGSLDSLRYHMGVWTDGTRLTMRPWQLRDIIRQQTLDHLQVIRALAAAEMDIDEDGTTDLDMSRVFYTGQSMGGIIGGVGGAVLPELNGVLLNVPGGRISNVLVKNEYFGSLVLQVMRPTDVTMADVGRMIAMMQTVLDPGDPINYVHWIQRESYADHPVKPLLIQAAQGDFTLPNYATFDLARVAGLPLTGPWKGSVPDLPTGNASEPLPGGWFSMYETIVRYGEDVRARHDNLWASDTGLKEALRFFQGE